MSVSRDQILDAMKKVQVPDFRQDIVALGLVKGLEIDGGKIFVTLELVNSPKSDKIRQEVENVLLSVPGVQGVNVNISSGSRPAPAQGGKAAAGIKNVISIASGKGGVGKSTVSVNLACALAKTGAKVGLMDADVYGPNIPLMMGIAGKPQADGQRIIPTENYGVKVMSMGFLVPEDQAVIWRGPMLHGAIQQFLNDVEWGSLDYLIVDLPPGTGDVQLSLSQAVPMTGSVFVTTPQAVSLQDVRRGIAMFQKVRVPILGLIENMSYFICSHCDGRTEIFSHGGGKQAADKLGLRFFGEIPLETAVREGGDTGKPVVVRKPDSEIAKRFMKFAEDVAAAVREGKASNQYSINLS